MRYDAGWTRAGCSTAHGAGGHGNTPVPTVGSTTGRKALNRVCHTSTACERVHVRKGGTPKG